LKLARTCVAVLVTAGALALLSVAPGRAAEGKAEAEPALALQTKFIEASVTLDKAVKADKPLTANLLAEGRRWMAKNRADAAKEFKSSPELFRNGRAWTFERNYRRASRVADRYVSVTRTDFIYTGGAHPNTNIDTILWDDHARKRISIRPFFKETADNGPTLTALREAAIAAVKAEKKARKIDEPPGVEWYAEVRPTLLKVGAVTLAASTEAGKSAGLTFHYPPYAVGSYVEGSYIVSVPWQTFRPYLSKEGAALFGGDLPPEASRRQ
jgi:hypothetical protein